MKKILVGVDGFTRGHIERLRRAVAGWGEIATIEEKATLEEYEPKLKEADIAVGWPDPELLRKHPVEFLQIGSAGPDKYLGKGLGSLHMRACSARGNYSLGIAEQAAAMYLYFKRKLHVHVKDKERHVFMRHEPYDEVEGSTVCVVGLGEAGSRVARKLHALGCRVIGVDRDKPGLPDCLERRYEREDLAEAVSQADGVFFIIPGGPATKHLVNAELLSRFKPTAFLVNISRGSVVDEAALYEALAGGRLAGAGLDVAAEEPMPKDNPLWDLDNVLITGHSAGLSEGVYDRLCDLVADNLRSYREGKPLRNEISLG